MRKKISNWVIVFLIVLAVIMVIVGFVRNDFLFYIRAGIFIVASLLIYFWWNKRK